MNMHEFFISWLSIDLDHRHCEQTVTMSLPPAIRDAGTSDDDDYETLEQQCFRLWFEALRDDPLGTLNMVYQALVAPDVNKR